MNELGHKEGVMIYSPIDRNVTRFMRLLMKTKVFTLRKFRNDSISSIGGWSFFFFFLSFLRDHDVRCPFRPNGTLTMFIVMTMDP